MRLKILLSLFAILLLVIPMFTARYVTSFILFIMMYITLAVSFDIIGGEMGYINLGHYVFFGIGAYMFAFFTISSGSEIIGFLASLIFPALLAVGLSFPLFKLKGDYFAFATLALLIFFEALMRNLPWFGGPYGLILKPKDTIIPSYYIMFVVMVICILVKYWVRKSKIGIALNSIKEDEFTAESSGIWLFKYKILALLLSSVFAGISGGVYAWYMTYLDPSMVFGLAVALNPIGMALFGGLGTMSGPILGALVVGTISQYLVENLRFLHLAVLGAIFVFVGLVMPNGLVGTKLAKRAALSLRRVFGYA